MQKVSGAGPCAAARPLTTSSVQQQAAAAGARPQPDQTGLQVRGHHNASASALLSSSNATWRMHGLCCWLMIPPS